MNLKWIKLIAVLLPAVVADGMEDADMKSLKTPLFTGKEKDFFSAWWMRFMACAGAMGFVGAVGRKKHPNLPAKEVPIDSSDEDENIIARKQNIKAMYCLTLSFSTEWLMGLIMKAKTTDWPSGLAYKVVDACPIDWISSSRHNRQSGIAHGATATVDKDDLIAAAIASVPAAHA